MIAACYAVWWPGGGVALLCGCINRQNIQTFFDWLLASAPPPPACYYKLKFIDGIAAITTLNRHYHAGNSFGGYASDEE
jgi:hypothetical protein